MLNIFKSLRGHPHQSMRERRQHPRRACVIKVYYLVQGTWYRGSIQNISGAGVYIRSTRERKHSKGEAVLMLVELRVLRDQIKGKIIRVESDGLAVAFHTSEPEYTELKALLGDHCLI
jgi:PilZ domain